jgi:hypothetical protein
MGHGHRNDRHEDDEDAHRPSSLHDPRAARPRGHIQVHAYGLDRARHNDAELCNGRDWSVTPQFYAHLRDRRVHDASARHGGSQRGRRGGLLYGRNWARERVSGCCASGWSSLSRSAPLFGNCSFNSTTNR